MSTSTQVVSLAADLVVFLAAMSLLAVLVLRPDLLGVSTLGRTVLAGAATLLAVAAVFHGALTESAVREDWLERLRVASIVLLAVGCLGVGARWPRTALLGSLGLLVVAEVGLRDREAAGNLLRLLGGCGIGLSLWLAARRSLATRIAAAAGVLLVAVVAVLSGVLSQKITEKVSEQAVTRAAERAEIEAELIAQKSNDAASQASFIANVFRLSPPSAKEAITREDPIAIGEFLNGLRSLYSQVDFLAFLNPSRKLVAATSPGESAAGASVLDQLSSSPTVADAYEESLPSAAAGVEQTLDAGLVALAADDVVLNDERGEPKVYGVVVAGSFLDAGYLTARTERDPSIALSIVTNLRLLASSRGDSEADLPVDLFDGGRGTKLIDQVFVSGRRPEGRSQFGGQEVFYAFASIPPDIEGVPEVAVVVTQDAGVINDTLVSLFRTLFLIAMAAAALALALAAATGSRLGAPLRKLARTAEQISQGDLSVRSGLDSPDEIGLLGSSFDEMAGSIERMTSELREGAAQMEAVLNSMADGLVAADPVGLVAMMNPAAETMLGVRASREMGKPVASVIRAQDRNGSPLTDRFELPNFEAWSAVGYVENRDRLLPVALSGAPIRSESGGVLGAVYVMRDMRRELEIEKAKTEFLSNISHELRTPLTPIKGYAEMLRRDQQMPESRQLAADKVRAFLDGILESSERLERTVDILVNFAAMQAGRLVLRTEPVEVASLIRDISERWRSRTDRHRVEEHVVGRPRVMADRRLLERSIDELIDNAVKYSPEGGIVSVRAQLIGTGDGRAVEVSVSDEGIGIAPADFERIFADFSQLDGSATRRYGGLGLGLPFVQRVVGAHGGTLDASSEPGRGSVFVIRLPITATGPQGNGATGP
jgi:PAS domain S-box-containing protein